MQTLCKILWYFASLRNKASACKGARFQGTQQPLTHRQIFHERNYRMYWQNRTSKLDYFFNIGSHFWILPNAIGWKITITHRFHNSRTRPIPIDHIAHGSPWLSCELPMPHGRCPQEYFKHNCLHWQFAGPYQNPWRPFKSVGPTAQLEDQSRQMLLQQQGSLLSGSHIHSIGHQTWQEQVEGHRGGKPSNGH